MNTAVEAFLSEAEESLVVDAIREAETQTSGEIRVHIENHTLQNVSVEERTKQIFHFLKMDTTKAQNGVLVYVAVNLKQFWIYGDQGIHQKVGNDFWNSTRDVILASFKHAKYCEGLTKGILQIGTQLQAHFPWEADDENELPNEISKGL